MLTIQISWTYDLNFALTNTMKTFSAVQSSYFSGKVVMYDSNCVHIKESIQKTVFPCDVRFIYMQSFTVAIFQVKFAFPEFSFILLNPKIDVGVILTFVLCISYFTVRCHNILDLKSWLYIQGDQHKNGSICGLTMFPCC